MTNKIRVQLSGSEIIISGNLDCLKKETIFWFKVRKGFQKINNNNITIKDNIYLKESELFAFKKFLTKREGDKIIFDENFNFKIEHHELKESHFEAFSLQARKIWTGDYDLNDFKKFTIAVDENLINRRLYKLQLLSAYHMAFSQHSCNFSVPGSGKTSIVYGAYSYLKSLGDENVKYVNKIIVIGPPSSFSPWIDEYKECFGKDVEYFILDGRNSKASKRNILMGTSSKEPELLLTTYQSFPSLLDDVIHFMKINTNRVMLICDEAHKFKGHEGVWSSSVLNSANYASSRVVLTGTPVPNGYEDLYNIFKFLYPDKNVIQKRRDTLLAMTRSRDIREIEEMIENIKPYFIRINKSDLNLPEVTKDLKISVKMNELESKVYSKLMSVLEDTSYENDILKTTIWHRIRQAASNLRLLNSKIDEDDLDFLVDKNLNVEKMLGPELYAKVGELDDNYIPSKHQEVYNTVKSLNGNKVVIWGYYINSIKSLDKYLKSKGLNGNIIIGETKKEKMNSDSDSIDNYLTREKIIEKFKTIDNYDYIITNPIVLGESVSLHKVCHHSIYFELDYSAAPYIQSRDRIHRVWIENGSQVNYETNYYHLLSRSKMGESVDYAVFNNVRAKFERMKEIIEHEIPLFTEDLEKDRVDIIQKILSDYRKNNN